MPYRFRQFAAAVAVVLLAAGSGVVARQTPAAPVRARQIPVSKDAIPFDAAVRTATLPNGVKLFVRHNAVPAKRVSLRLAVKAGSMNEADDQQGLAHLIEHMAFNGSAHFKPGELVSTFESVGARLGPHVNAYTSFDETVYMLDLPTDNPEIVTKGLTALADFAGGLTLDPAEIDMERGVVIEEWRGGLGAGSRIRDKQIPVIFDHSRYANRLPIGKPEIIRTAAPARLRAFYDTWYRPERIAVVVVGDADPQQLERGIRAAFGPLAARAPLAPDPDRRVPLNQQLLVSVASDPEVTRSNVQLMRKRPGESETRVTDYRRDLLYRLIVHMIGDRFAELARRPDAPFLGAGASSGSLSRTVNTFTFNASVPDGKIQDGLAALVVEAKRVHDFGFGAGELDRAKLWMSVFMERAYNERDKTESESFAREYVDYFIDKEPSPGIAYEYQLVQRLLPTVTPAEVSALARTLLNSTSRVLLAVSPQKASVSVPSESDLRAAVASAEDVAVTAWTDTTLTRDLLVTKPTPSAISARREVPEIGATVVRFANGVEAWLKPTDFKNDQIVFDMEAPGGASLASCADLPEATLASAYVGLAGVGGLKALDLQKMLAGKLASSTPYIALSTHGVSGGAAPSQLETALQLLYQDFTAPNDDPEAFGLLTRQLSAAVANRGQAPLQVFGERLAQVNSSNHCTSSPLTPERVSMLDRARMTAFYHDRFSNAADFTFFMVGAFKVDDVVPMLARYVGTLPSTGQATSRVADLGIHFPNTNQRIRVEKGREPQAQTVISFFADPMPTPIEQEYVVAATTVLDIALRDILREELGQTYTVSVGLSQPLPQRGAGHIQVRFGSAPENAAAMADRVMQEIKRLQQEGPSADVTNRAKEAAKRGYEEALRDNSYWLRRLSFIRLVGGDPRDIVTRNERIDSITPKILQEVLQKDFPFDRNTIVTLVPEAKP